MRRVTAAPVFWTVVLQMVVLVEFGVTRIYTGRDRPEGLCPLDRIVIPRTSNNRHQTTVDTLLMIETRPNV